MDATKKEETWRFLLAYLMKYTLDMKKGLA